MDKKTLITLIMVTIGGMVIGNYWEGRGNSPGAETGSFTPAPDREPISERQNSPGALKFQDLFAEVIEHIEPSLVNISAVHIVEVQEPFFRFHHGDPFEDFFRDFFDRQRRERPEPREEEREATGSGFIISAEGHVLTNYHVVRGADELKITDYRGDTYDAEVIGRDSRTDLAVVKIESDRGFDALRMGDSDEARKGDWVIAAGSPFGLQETYTSGIISAIRQDVQVENAVYEDMLQTDAAINMGNSGGPLVNLDGEVVGINTAIFAPTGVFAGVGFAIPINQATRILDDLIEEGRVARGWLGVEIAEVDEAIQRQFSLPSDKGVLINRVMDDSAAQEAGIERGDVIVDVNGEEIEGVRVLQRKIMGFSPATEITLGIIRDEERIELDVTLKEMPEDTAEAPVEEEEEEEGEASWRGISVSNITGRLKNQYDLQVDEGVVITGIDPREEGQRVGLRVGDVINEINNRKVETADDFAEIMEDVSLEEGVVFDVLRDGSPVYISYTSRR